MSSIAHSTSSADKTIGGASAHPAVRIWLFAVAGLLFAMVIVGGATRLTDSGLSITEWQPLLGAIPPLTEVHWLEAFEKYKQIPQYTLVNEGMSLSEFKAIYWWEWAHRFLGRFIGVAFFVPLVFFWLRGAIPAGLKPRLIALFLLGGAQGALGWYMVQSGLAERIDVSQYRLTAHLGLAVLIYGAILWVAFGLGAKSRRIAAGRGLKFAAAIFAALIFLQFLAGGFVAGTDAGLSHNTWPLIDGQIIPNGLLAMDPWYLNLFENVLTVQFNHRMLGYLIAVAAVFNLWLAFRASDAQAKRLALVAAAIVTAQIALGVFALLTQLQIGLALAHQAGALILLAFALYQLHVLAQAPKR
jgi:cytochrome c oxidase assembly protein subunit 15